MEDEDADYLYDLNTSLAANIAQDLKKFKNFTDSYPDPKVKFDEDTIHVTTNNDNPKLIAWKELIQKMIWSFDEIANLYPNNPSTLASKKFFDDIYDYRKKHNMIDEGKYPWSQIANNIDFGGEYNHPTGYFKDEFTDEDIKLYNERIKNGLKLFANNFQELWI